MAANTQKINAKSAIKYMLLPGILPRAREFLGGGFGYLAFLFAQVYGAVRILPKGHPYLNPDNIGKFGVIQAISAAANNLKVDRYHIDQLVVFFVLVVGVILMFLQFLLLILAFVTGKAFAQDGADAPFESMFITPYPDSDIAFLLLDYVFGIPGKAAPFVLPGQGDAQKSSFFGSHALAEGPTAFHQGLHALFNFYNLTLLLVAVLIFLYYVFVVVIETAQTGVPFGKRFSKIYAPIRLIIAVGLLVPLNYGFNGAQYITLYAAKIGSSFATNGWILYNTVLANPIGADNKSLLARPRTPAIDDLAYFSSVYHACREMYAIWNAKDNQNPGEGGICIKSYLIVDGTAQEFASGVGDSGTPETGMESPAYLAACGAATKTPYSYADAKKYFGNTDIEVVLGEEDTKKHPQYAGGVEPYCGKITISLSNDNPAIYKAPHIGGEGTPQTETGVRAIESLWYGQIRTLLKPERVLSAFGERAAYSFIPSQDIRDTCWKSGILGDAGTCGEDKWYPPVTAFSEQIKLYRQTSAAEIRAYYETFRNNLDLKLPEELKKRGWGGAGIWYNHIADLNGTMTSAIYAVPSVKQFPEIMEYVKQQRQIQDNSTSMCDMYMPNLADGRPIYPKDSKEFLVAEALDKVYQYHFCSKASEESGTAPSPAEKKTPAGSMACGDDALTPGATGSGSTANVFINIIANIFGINGLFDIRCNSKIDETTGMAEIHPLAQFATVGRSLVENAIRSMAMAIGAAFGGGIIGTLGQESLGTALQSVSGMFTGIATIGLTVGFILYYILPFLPFMYFFFAVGSWVKSIFEAMLGAPLWALAHLRIDGDGLPGRAAAGGYFMILEIALRPMFILFGLIAGMSVFGALAVALNNLFDLVIINTTGALPGPESGSMISTGVESFRRGIIDQFFFTIMYAILLYMMATSSFKMIDVIPQHVMRWIGSSVPVFNDNNQDPTQGLTQYAAIGGSQIGGQVMQGITGGAKGVGQGIGGLFNAMKGPPPNKGEE